MISISFKIVGAFDEKRLADANRAFKALC